MRRHLWNFVGTDVSPLAQCLQEHMRRHVCNFVGDDVTCVAIGAMLTALYRHICVAHCAVVQERICRHMTLVHCLQELMRRHLCSFIGLVSPFVHYLQEHMRRHLCSFIGPVSYHASVP